MPPDSLRFDSRKKHLSSGSASANILEKKGREKCPGPRSNQSSIPRRRARALPRSHCRIQFASKKDNTTATSATSQG